MFLFKYVFSKYKQNKFQTILNILSIALGLSIILAIQLSTANNIMGLHQRSKELNGGDICVTPVNNSKNQDATFKLLDDLDEVDYTVSVWQKESVKYGHKSANIILRFVNLEKYPYYGKKINVSKEENSNSIVLSKNLASQLGTKRGEKILLFNSRKGEEYPFYVNDVVELDGETGWDMNLFGYGFIDSKYINDFFGDGDLPVNKIYIKVKQDSFEHVLKELGKIYNPDEIKTADENFAQMEQEVRTITKSVSIIGLFAAIMGGVGIACLSILNMNRRQQELCMLRVLGMKKRQLHQMVLLDSCIIGIVAFICAVPMGIGITFIINKLFFYSYDFVFYSKYLLDFLLVLLISIGISCIFSIIPNYLYSELSPIMILRQEELSAKKRMKLTKPILIILSGITAAGTIYYDNLMMIAYMAGIFIFAFSVYVFIKTLLIIINFLLNIPVINNSIIKLIIIRMNKQSKKLCLIIVTLTIGLVSIGLTQNISGSILPGVEELIKSELGYNLLLTSPKTNEESINNMIQNTKSITGTAKTLRINGTIDSINGVSIEDYLEDDDYKNREKLNNLTFEGVETSNINAKILKGRLFSTEDVKTIVINNEFADALSLDCGDTIELRMGAVKSSYKIIGIFEKQLVNTSEIKMPLDSLSNDIMWSSVTYYMNVDEKDLDEVINTLYNKIGDCFIVNMLDMAPSLYKTVREQMSLFTGISIISIISFILFMTNILLIDLLGRKKEWYLYRVYGAKNKTVIFMMMVEAILIGVIASIIAYSVCSFSTKMFLKVFLDLTYTRTLVKFTMLLIIAIGISLVSMILVLPKLKFKNMNELLREY